MGDVIDISPSYYVAYLDRDGIDHCGAPWVLPASKDKNAAVHWADFLVETGFLRVVLFSCMPKQLPIRITWEFVASHAVSF